MVAAASICDIEFMAFQQRIKRRIVVMEKLLQIRFAGIAIEDQVIDIGQLGAGYRLLRHQFAIFFRR